MKKYFNAAEIARLEDISRATITRYIKKGQFKNVRKMEKEWRIPLPSYEEWWESTRLENLKTRKEARTHG